MPAFDEAELLRVLNRAVEQRIERMNLIHGTTVGDATRMGRNVPQGHAYPTTIPGFGTGYNSITGLTVTPFTSDYSIVGGDDLVTGS